MPHLQRGDATEHLHTADQAMANADHDLDEFFMRQALDEATRALGRGEIPVGAVIVQGERIIARAHNLRELAQDPTAHAEMVALRQAASRTGSWRLEGLSLYVTLEPCLMCAGALVLARVARVIYGCDDPKGGALRSLYAVGDDSRLNHRFVTTAGVLGEDCSRTLSDFFAALRLRRRKLDA